jgi:hypothetical protein
MHALIRARIPYLPIHVDDIEKKGASLKLLILPNVGALSGDQAGSIRRFVERGGGLFATGRTGLYNEWGDPRPDFALAEVLGCHHIGEVARLQSARRETGTAPGAFAPSSSGHTYLRLTPEWRARTDGPKAGDEPIPAGERHPVLAGFEETDLLPFGGILSPLEVDKSALVPLTFIPAFPTYPPETAWMRQPKTDIPGLVLSTHGQSRVAFMPADIDRRYAREHLPDHARLLANVVRWVVDDNLPLQVEGTGLIDCHLYTQKGRMILHIVNLTSEASWRAPLDELIRVGPFKVRIRAQQPVSQSAARLLVSGKTSPIRIENGMIALEITSILDHELIVIE